MRKEILFAILAGAVFGLIIAFGVWRLNQTIGPVGENQTEASPTPSAEFSISVAEPIENQVITTSPVTVTGITRENTWLSISGEDEDYIIQSDEEGVFEVEVALVGGINQIVITAFDNNGSSVSRNLTLVYSTEFEERQ